jgi:hypothetical protein
MASMGMTGSMASVNPYAMSGYGNMSYGYSALAYQQQMLAQQAMAQQAAAMAMAKQAQLQKESEGRRRLLAEAKARDARRLGLVTQNSQYATSMVSSIGK